MTASPLKVDAGRVRVDFPIDDEAVASAIPMHHPQRFAFGADSDPVQGVDVFRQAFLNMNECFAETGRLRCTLASRLGS